MNNLLGTITLSPAQYKYKSAFQPMFGDPLLRQMVNVVEPDWRSRIGGEVDGTDVKKWLKLEGINHIPGASR